MKPATAIACLLVVMNAFAYNGIVKQISAEYNRKQTDYNEMAKAARYQWEIVNVIDFPYWCLEGIDCEKTGEKHWIDGHGQVLLETAEGVYIGVRSWIDRKDDDKAQVTRLFLYKQNSNGVWYRVRTIKVTQVWEESAGWVCQR